MSIGSLQSVVSGCSARNDSCLADTGLFIESMTG